MDVEKVPTTTSFMAREEAQLAELGYKKELQRKLSKKANIVIRL